MYSDISSRIIARSSSNRNSARARAVSVFPTPVGPRKMNEPTGRFGSCKPARARRTAFETASRASVWPITRLPKFDSIWTSFCISPSSIFETGTPVHLATTSATSSSSTSSLRKTPSCCSSARRACSTSRSFSISGILPYWISAAFARSPAWRACSSSRRACSSCSLAVRIFSISSFSDCHLAFIADEVSLRSPIRRSMSSRRSFDFLSVSRLNACRSISSCKISRSRTSISCGSESISIRIRDAASSIRSIALSGKKRSVIYLFESVAAATIAASLIRTP